MKRWKLWIGLVSVLAAATALAERVPPGTNDEITQRLAPFGEVCRTGDPCASAAASAASSSGPMSGQQVYDKFCSACHATGVAGAPQTGVADAWQPRIGKGLDTLWQHVQSGFNAMPPKGTCMSCSDEELRSAMDYLVGQAE